MTPKEDLFNLYKTESIKKEINFIWRRMCVLCLTLISMTETVM